MAFNSTFGVTITDPEYGYNDNVTRYYQTQSMFRIIIESVVLLFIWMVSVPASTLVCVVIYRSRRVQSTTNYFVVSLAISDILMTLFCVPFVASRIVANGWVLGSVMCRLVRFLQIIVPTSTTFVLVSISIDRFYTIIYPLRFKITRGTAKHLISGCWILSFISCIFTIYLYEPFRDDNDSGKLFCPTFIPNWTTESVIYGAVFTVFTYLLPAIFMITMYARIFRYVWTAGIRHRRIQRTTNPVARNKVKMLKMLIIVSTLTLSFSTPHYIVQICYTFSSVSNLHPVIFIITFVLMFLTTILKPLIYMLYNSNFRRGCREVFCMSNMKCYRSHTYAITTASNIGKKNHVGIMPVENGHPPTIHSPTFIFNRTVLSEKTAWPVAANISTTYL